MQNSPEGVITMDPNQFLQVVNILSKDGPVIKKWTELKDSLDLENDGNFVSLEERYKQGTVPASDLLSEILTAWQEEKGREATLAKLCEILENLHLNSTAETLKTTFDLITAPNCNTFFHIGAAVWNFVGRSTEIIKLTTLFNGEKRFIAKVIGLGGIGKSNLVKKFASSYINKTNGFWLNGDSSESLHTSIVQTATKLRVHTTEDNQQKNSVDLFSDIIAAIKRTNKLKILVIVDNVDTENVDVNLILHIAVKLRVFVVVTSRNSRAVGNAGELVNLYILEDEDAHQFIRDSIDGETAEDISKLCILLNNFPLALQQAVAFIQTQKSQLEGESYKIPNYLKKYKQNKVQMLAQPLDSIEHEYRETTLVTWNVSIAAIRQRKETGALAIQLLNIIAYFDADDISLEFIKSICTPSIQTDIGTNEESYEEAVNLLKSNSLIKAENCKIYIHRLVQEVTRVNCNSSELEVQLLRKLIQSIDQIRNKLKQSDMPHVISVWKHAFSYEEIVRDFSTFPEHIITTMCNLSLYREMLDFTNVSHGVLSKILGDEHLLTLRLESQVAEAMQHNGKYEDSLAKVTVVYEKQVSILGKEDESTLVTGHNMAWVLHILDRYDEAVELFQSVLESKKTGYGETHKQTIVTKAALASVLVSQGKTNEAMKMKVEVFEWMKTELGEENPETLKAKHNIGDCLYEQDEFEKAKKIFEEVLELEVKVVGEEHASTLTTKYMLAFTLAALGEIEAGLGMLREVLVSTDKVLGPQHPDAILTRNAIDSLIQ